jgi:hypothetical protein
MGAFVVSEKPFANFREFWPYYVREHSHPMCRAFHFVGSTLVLAVLVASIWYGPWLLLAAPVVGYGFAWFSHFTIERNRPATFKYPLWSLIADWKMWFLMLIGRMQPEVARANELAGSGARVAAGD